MRESDQKTPSGGINLEAEEALEDWRYNLGFIPYYFTADKGKQLKESIAWKKKQANISNPSLSAELTAAFFEAFRANDDSEDIMIGVGSIVGAIQVAEDEIAGKTEVNLSRHEKRLAEYGFSENEIGWRLNSYRERAQGFASLLRGDSSGFALLKAALQNIKSEGYIPKLQIEIPNLKPVFSELVIFGAESAVDVYKRFYNLCPPISSASQWDALRS
ncbi:MAG: hypothetical protein A3C22_00940 [Candidatus Levybacteria bacterium RIFCSPHIGHO2_02_FULL_37_10]|nr:MAG: hypothetical protein A3C22_00940 [Candidatus Levybacteria bacterium RIFCSPHIGHO2_02_FULL_37_10]